MYSKKWLSIIKLEHYSLSLSLSLTHWRFIIIIIIVFFINIFVINLTF